MFRKFYLPVIGFLLIVIGTTVPSLVYSESEVIIHRDSIPTESEDVQVHALLILGNDPTIAEVLEKDSSKMQALLNSLSENCDVHVTVMDSQQTEVIKTDQTTAWIRDLEPKANDTILVYYAGHGTVTKSGSHVLHFDVTKKDIMKRDKLRDLLEQKQCRLKLLITDIDSSGPPVKEPLSPTDVNIKLDPTAIPMTQGEALTHLFLEHTGFLNLTAASEGEYAWIASSLFDSIFTFALHTAISEGLDLDGDDFLSWEEVFKLTRQYTILAYQEISVLFSELTKSQIKQKGIESQRPKYYGELPKRIETEATD